MDAPRLVNWIEVFLWGFIGLAFVWIAVRGKVKPRWEPATLAVTFLLFGLSDYVELQTGAWWEPWGLAVWKVASGFVLVVAYLIYRKRTHTKNGVTTSD